MLEYNLTHPYPRSGLFTIITLVLIVLAMPALVIVNSGSNTPGAGKPQRLLTCGTVITVGYELVPSLQQDFQNQAAPWWTSARLPKIMRGKLPECQPKDMGRGDVFRLSASLFEYKVISSWHTSADVLRPEDEGRVEYHGESFNKCSVYGIRFDYDLSEGTHTLTVSGHDARFEISSHDSVAR